VESLTLLVISPANSTKRWNEARSRLGTCNSTRDLQRSEAKASLKIDLEAGLYYLFVEGGVISGGRPSPCREYWVVALAVLSCWFAIASSPFLRFLCFRITCCIVGGSRKNTQSEVSNPLLYNLAYYKIIRGPKLAD
jgi:hypothetical protein